MSNLDASLIEVVLTIAVSISSLTFYFIRQSIQKLTEQFLDFEKQTRDDLDDLSDGLKHAQIDIAVLKADVDHLNPK